MVDVNKKDGIASYKSETEKNLKDFDKMMEEAAKQDKVLVIHDQDGGKYEILTSQLRNLSAQKSVNNKVLVKVKHIKSSDVNSNHLVLRYYDQKKGEFRSEDKLGGEDVFMPQFYRDHYSSLMSQPNMVFYCLFEDLKDIKEMLKQDQEIIKKKDLSRNDAIGDFLTGLEIKKQEVVVDEVKKVDNTEIKVNNISNEEAKALDDLSNEPLKKNK